MSRSDLLDTEVGASIGELQVPVDTVHIFMFSAITWNRHLIHYDLNQANAEGHQSVVAQRGLLGNYFARLVIGWLAGRGEMTRLGWKVVRSAVPGDTLVCRGSVVAVDGGQVDVALEMVNDAGVVATGTASVRIDTGDGGAAAWSRARHGTDLRPPPSTA
ncbi:MAG: hypothetical protein R2761_17070 [Acidimicrobiales bacterium]